MINRPHIMGSVSQFNQQNTDIFAHRQDQFTEVFGLFIIRLHFNPCQFGDAIHQPCDFIGKLLLDVFKRDICIFDHIMKQSGDDGGRVKVHIGQDMRDLNRVGEIRLT